MVTQNEVMISVKSDTKDAVDNLNKMGNSVQTNMGAVSKSITSAFDGLSDKLNNFSSRFSNMNSVMSGALSTLGGGSFKSLTVDLAMTRDQMKNLLTVTMQGSDSFEVASQKADSFINTMKEGTSTSVVKLSMMIEAMNGIKLSTGMANESLESLNDVIRTVGEASLLMGDDAEHATFVMKEAMSGLNGDFAVLKEQFGITKEKMISMGWSGQANDVETYRQALEKCLSGLGDMSQVMDTTSGKISKIKSSFSSAGMKIGEQFLPAIDSLATAFLNANENGNVLTKGILYIGGATSVLSGLGDTLNPYIGSLKDAVSMGSSAYNSITKLTSGMEGLEIAQKLTGAAAFIQADGQKKAALSETEGALAAQIESGANVGLGASFQAAATGAYELAVAILTNPIFWIAVTIIAVVAVLWHLYNTNEQVRQGINDLAESIKGGLIQAWNLLVEGAKMLWAGLEQLGGVIYNMLVPAWNQLMVQLQPLWTSLMELYDTFRALWATLTGGSNTVSETGNNINFLAEIGKAVGTVIAGLAQEIILFVQIVLSVLIPAITFVVDTFSILIGVINGILNVYSALSNGTMTTGEALGALGEIVSEAISELGAVFVYGIQNIIDNLDGVWNSLSEGVRNEIANMANEFMNTHPITAAIINLASSIVHFFLDLLGIHSPGFMAQAIQEEMEHIAEFITGAVGTIVGAIVSLVTNILTTIQLYLAQIRTTVTLLVGMIIQAIVTRFNQIVASVRMVFSMVVQSIRTRLNQARAVASNLATMIRTVIVQRIQTVVTRIRTLFTQIVSSIRSRLANAASTARQKAVEIYNNIVNKVRELPGRVGSEIASLATTIKDKLVQAGVHAFEGAKHLVAQFLAGMGIASPGIIQRSTATEFASLPGIIMDADVQATKATSNMAKNISNAWTDNLKEFATPEIDTSTMMNSINSLNMIPIRQFEAFNPNIYDIGNGVHESSLLSNNLDYKGVRGITTSNTNNTVNNDDHTIIYNIDNVTFDCNNLEGKGKEIFYNVLDELYPGGI